MLCLMYAVIINGGRSRMKVAKEFAKKLLIKDLLEIVLLLENRLLLSRYC